MEYVKLPILSKATVKRAAKTCNVFCNITAKQVERRWCAFFAHVQTCLTTNQVVASCVNSNFWLNKVSRITPYTGLRDLRKKVCLAPTKRATSTDLICCKTSLSSNSTRQLAARFTEPCDCKTVSFFFVKFNRYSERISFTKVKTLPRGTQF